MGFVYTRVLIHSIVLPFSISVLVGYKLVTNFYAKITFEIVTFDIGLCTKNRLWEGYHTWKYILT